MEIILHRPKNRNPFNSNNKFGIKHSGQSDSQDHNKRPHHKKLTAIKVLSLLGALVLILNVAFYNYVQTFFNTVIDAKITRPKIPIFLTPIEQIDNLFIAAEAKNNFNGNVLFAKNGTIMFEKSYGYANKEKNIRNNTDTKFPIASLTKSFTAFAIMQLNEQGIVNLDDPITKFIPSYRIGRLITIQNLLDHQSGVWNYPNNSTKAPNPIKKDDLINMIVSKQLIFRPGSRFSYSNSNYILLSAVIEKASGQNYEDYIKSKILEPLNMKDTGFVSSSAVLRTLDSNVYAMTEYSADDLANGYEYDPSTKDLKPAEYIHPTHVWGAGSMYSTVEDLLKWDQSLYTNKLATQDSLEQIFTPDKGKYGYGWNITSSSIGGKSRILIWHQGLIAGFNGLVYRYPEDRVTVIVLKNMENPTLNITDQAIKLFWQSLLRK